jgi:hypothetical protein
LGYGALSFVDDYSRNHIPTGRIVRQTGAGPKPIQYKKLTVIKLSEAIKYALGPTAKEAARRIARRIHDDVRLFS